MKPHQVFANNYGEDVALMCLINQYCLQIVNDDQSHKLLLPSFLNAMCVMQKMHKLSDKDIAFTFKKLNSKKRPPVSLIAQKVGMKIPVFVFLIQVIHDICEGFKEDRDLNTITIIIEQMIELFNISKEKLSACNKAMRSYIISEQKIIPFPIKV